MIRNRLSRPFNGRIRPAIRSGHQQRMARRRSPEQGATGFEILFEPEDADPEANG